MCPSLWLLGCTNAFSLDLSLQPSCDMAADWIVSLLGEASLDTWLISVECALLAGCHQRSRRLSSGLGINQDIHGMWLTCCTWSLRALPYLKPLGSIKSIQLSGMG